MVNSYAPIVIIWSLTIGLAVVLLFFSVFFGLKKPTGEKSSPYESGITPVGDATGKFPVKYYIMGALFILFDIEAVFLIAWAVASKDLGLVALVEVAVFILVIFAGYFYALFKGALSWR